MTVWDADPRTADEKLRLVERVIQGRDFTAMAETINAVDAWLGSLPGMSTPMSVSRRFPRSISPHMIPVSGVGGAGTGRALRSTPLLFGKTEGSTPFRFSPCRRCRPYADRRDRRRQTVLLALMARQFRRYPGAQVFAFDFGGSIRAAALAMRGDWHDLGGGLTEAAPRGRAATARPRR